MEQYYFIGKKCAVTAEIINILEKKGISYECVNEGRYGIYDVSQEKVDEIITQGKRPYLVGISSVRQGAVKVLDYKVNCAHSALLSVAVDCGETLSDWQNLILANDEDAYNHYPYSVNQMAELVRMGYSKRAIEKVRAYDRAQSGVTPEEEKAAELCLEKMTMQNQLRIVKDLPHEKFRTITDRLFWLQDVQNVVIFTTTGSLLYAGFADVAFNMFKHFGGVCSYAFWDGSFKNEEEQNRIIRLLSQASRKKVQGGLL